MNTGLTVDYAVRFDRKSHGRKQLETGLAPVAPVVTEGRVPRISKLMALAIRFDELVNTGQVRDYAELARLGHVTRARMTQIMNLLNLAPDIQETLLFLPRVNNGRAAIREYDLRPIAAVLSWTKQRDLWKQTISPVIKTTYR